jgi:hypothetical protein
MGSTDKLSIGDGVSEQQIILLNIGRDEKTPLVYPSFSNFLQVSRVATEVQFDFLFVDVNEIAVTIQKAKESPGEGPPKLSGVLVARVVLPALNFVQMRDHINGIFDAIEKELGKLPTAKEVQHGNVPVAQAHVRE